MKVAIMQPYLFPYIGYFQLMHSVDTFVVYDNIKYTKKGWINRNRILVNGEPSTFSVPIKKASDSLNVNQREISAEFDYKKLLGQMEGAYRKAPFFAETFPFLENILKFAHTNLFTYIFFSLEQIRDHLRLQTELVTSSQVAADHSLKAEERVISICKAMSARTYINASGGTELYDPKHFEQAGLSLRFNRPLSWIYPQFGGEFVPWLSIIDALMFNGASKTHDALIKNYKVTEG